MSAERLPTRNSSPDCAFVCRARNPSGRGVPSLLRLALRLTPEITSQVFGSPSRPTSAIGPLYRPLYSEQYGYRGTRYFPLQIQSYLARCCGSDRPRITGYLYALAVMGVPARRTLCPPPASRRSGQIGWGVLRAVSGRKGLAGSVGDVRGDALPVALYVWGLALCAGGSSTRRSAAAAMLFTAAFAAKITAGDVVVGVVASLALSGQFSAARRPFHAFGRGI